MKIIYKIIRYKSNSHPDFILGWKKGDMMEIRLKEIEKYCCNEMKEAIEDGFVIFGEADSYLNRDNNLNISQCSPYPEGAVWCEMPIKFCPFCAERIEIEGEEN